jgi:hypothetical protein
MQYKEKLIYYISFALLMIFCLIIFIKPDTFSFIYTNILFTILIIAFFIINYRYKKKISDVKNYNFVGISFFIISVIFLIYSIIKYLNR